MTWVRFHGELRFGEKRGIPKAIRFTYMELSHESRPKKGIVVLAHGLSDVDAVREIVGGTRKEAAEAIRVLSSPPFEMIRFDEVQGKRVLIITNWEKWNPSGDDSSGRVRNWRDAKKRKNETKGNGDGNELHDVTVTQDVAAETESRAPASAPARATLTLSSLDLTPSEQGSSKTERDEERVSETRVRSLSYDEHRMLDRSEPLDDELRNIADLANVQDITGAWLKFCGHYAGQILNVSGYWQKWCVIEAKHERTERHREAERRARINRPEGPTDPTDPYHSPEARKARDDAEQRRRDAEYRKREAEAADPKTINVRELLDKARAARDGKTGT
jgi:hypothetical protein